MKKPNPSETTSTGMPAAIARRANGTNPASCGWAAATSNSASVSVSTIAISSVIRRREPISPAS